MRLPLRSTLFPYTTLFRSYEKIGYPCYEVSALERTNISQVQALLKEKVTLFSGHSGVGKSSLRSEEHTSELQSRGHLVCRLLLEKKKKTESNTTCTYVDCL